MKIIKILFSQFLIILFHSGSAQKVFDTTFMYTPLNELSRMKPAMDSLSFSVASNGTHSLMIYSKKYWQSPGYTSATPKAECYDLNFEGDKYLLEKRWGAVPLPEMEIAFIVKHTCRDYFDLEGHWRNDSVFIQQRFRCRENSEDEIFEKVPWTIAFKPGKEKLKERLEKAAAQYKQMRDNITSDAVYIFRVLVASDSSIKSIEILEGEYSSFAGVLMDELKKSGPWTPANQGGRSVKAYLRIFVRLDPKNRLVVDY